MHTQSTRFLSNNNIQATSRHKDNNQVCWKFQKHLSLQLINDPIWGKIYCGQDLCEVLCGNLVIYFDESVTMIEMKQSLFTVQRN